MADKKRSIKVEFQQKPEKEVPLAAYTINRAGKVTGAVPVSGGKFDLPDLTKDDVARVVLGPALPSGGSRELPTMSMLQRLQVVDVPLRAGADVLNIPVFPPPWLLCFCIIRGQVVREVGGHAHPVCRARVHVCEVDPWPWIILKLSDDAIRTIRADILGIPIDVRPIPGPGPDPGPLVTINPTVLRAISTASELNPQPLPPRAITEVITKEQTATFRSAVTNLPASLKTALSSESTTQIRQAISANFEWISPLIWYWPWFWYTCEEIGWDDTDDNGRFTLSTWYPCRGDKPDLYFWVEYFIAGSWTTVYRPPIRLTTHWDYPCGSDVTIRITDERVPFCDPDPGLPGKKLIVTTIGNNESVARIKRASAGADRGLTFDGNPFGGQLEPHVDFGVGLSAANTSSPIPFYYRWSYRKFGSGDPFTPLDAHVYRRYRVEPAVGNPEYRSYQLGPFTVGATNNLFRIRPKNVLDPDGPAEWVVLNMRDDTTSAYFYSHLLDGGNPVTAAGKYELLLELFNSAGALISDWGAAGIQGYIPVDGVPAPFAPGISFGTQLVTGSVPLAEFDYKPAAVSAGMIFVLHVDNNPCEAQIFAVTVPGSVADDNCGFYEYPHSGATVGVSFKAKHPNDFADFTFDIYRGASNFVEVASLPAPRPPSSMRVGTTGNGFSFNAGTFVYSKSGIAIHDMLGDCDKAAFSETLYVAAMATDGWSRLSGYDRAGIPRAFALAPQHP